MDKETQLLWAKRIVLAIEDAFPTVTFSTWKRCQEYLPHVLVCDTLIETYHLALPQAAHLLHRAGWYLDDHAQYIQAEPLLRHRILLRSESVR